MTEKISSKEIVSAVNEVLDQYNMPMTLRQIYYRLVAKHLIENKMNQYKRLSKVLVKAREEGQVPYWMIEDRIRTTSGGDYGWDDPDDYADFLYNQLREGPERYSRPRWENQPLHVEVWIEKDALSSIAGRACNPYRVPLNVTRGYSSFSFVMSAKDRFKSDRENVILYCGDFDPSGEDMVRDLETRMNKYLPGYDITMVKVCLTPEQIEEYNLPPMPTKTSDSRASKFMDQHGAISSVELDALEPPVLQRIIREAIADRIDEEAWDESIEQEREDKERLTDRIKELLGDDE